MIAPTATEHSARCTSTRHSRLAYLRKDASLMRATEQELIKKHLEDLYASNRGALYSNSLIQAQVAFEKKEYSRTLELVKSSRELFERRHQKTLHGDPQRPDGKSNTSKKDRLAFQSKQAKAIETLGITGRFEPSFNAALGFDGITIALLARANPIATIPAALLVGILRAGSSGLQFETGIEPEVVNVILALTLLLVAAPIVARLLFRKRAMKQTTVTSGWGS